MTSKGESQNSNSSSPDSFGDLQRLLDQWPKRTPEVKRLILERGLDRMRGLAFKMLHESFPKLANEHDLDSIVNETWLRLAQALEQSNPPTVLDFFRLAAYKIRHVLLDMVGQQHTKCVRLYASQDTSLGGQLDPSLLRYVQFHSVSTSACAVHFPNAWGMFDMLGNVEEWCDFADASSKSPIAVARGGNASFTIISSARSAQASLNQKFQLIGFRVCREL